MSLKTSIFLVIATTHLLFGSISCIDFIYNTNFTSTNLLLVGTATVQTPPSILTLTNDTAFSIGRALYPSRISAATPTSSALSVPLPFATSFIFSMAPYGNSRLPGHGFAFVFLPSAGIDGADSSQHLGMFNFTNNGKPSNRIVGVEFDVFANQEFNDINDNHVGVDVNSLSSVSAAEAGSWGGKNNEKFTKLKLNSGANYQVWIEFNGSAINVAMAKAGEKRPGRPLISTSLNLTGVLLDEMFVGFTGATGQLVQSHRILAWSFSNSNFSIGDALVTTNLPSFVLPKNSVFQSTGFIAGVSAGTASIVVVVLALYVIFHRWRQQRKGNEDIEDWETEYWPHRIFYQEILAATNCFSEENVIGFGGTTKVYKGVLAGTDVAVKRIISHENVCRTREFVAEVSSLGRLKHRNLVGLRGWCRSDKGGLILVYDYMENGSVDKRIFDCDETSMLSWDERMNVLRDVASGILYLHEGWEAKVLHRDIKSSNVLLDKYMNARLGDFGLAKMQHHSRELASTTRVVGTVGYMAPELVRTGRASTQTDVYGFGVLVLEVVCGRRPIEEGKPSLIEWLWRLEERDGLVDAVDERLKCRGGLEKEELERFLHIGMLCAYHNARMRPTMRQVVKILEGGRVRDDENEGSDREGMEVSLLERIRSSQSLGTGSQHHPTFEDLQLSFTSSDSIFEGR